MATRAILIVGDGIIEIPEEFKGDPRLRKGARLRLVENNESPLELVSEGGSAIDRPADWRRLRGILAGSAFDPNLELDRERLRELESEKS